MSVWVVQQGFTPPQVAVPVMPCVVVGSIFHPSPAFVIWSAHLASTGPLLVRIHAMNASQVNTSLHVLLPPVKGALLASSKV